MVPLEITGVLELHIVHIVIIHIEILSCSLFQDSDTDSSPLNPIEEVKGHALGPASLALSPHKLWLASLGRDGVLQVRETISMVKCLFFLSLSIESYFRDFFVDCKVCEGSQSVM